ncbi:hypothetical protein [Litoribacillus peritrichatus]|uniref:Uncharacterized protein n=1 Tax=Litoribacillus peritrichatus TaxID=718191 RepID=A0ABP7N6W6_9GAMM
MLSLFQLKLLRLDPKPMLKSRLLVSGLLAIFSFSFCFSNALAADSVPNSVTSDESVARLSLKHVLYSQYQEDYLTAITDVLVAESKNIWNHLPKDGLREGSEQQEPLKQNLQLIEASLYHYFGLEAEAEKRYLSVANSDSQHLPTAYLLLAKYYHEQTQYKNALKWLAKIDTELLNENTQGLTYYYQIDSYLRLGDVKRASAVFDKASEGEWLSILAYNSDRIVSNKDKGTQSSRFLQNNPLLTLDKEDLVPMKRELLAFQMIQAGMDAVTAKDWPKAVTAFSKVPKDSMRIVEARRWLAWSLENNDQLEPASRVWRTLTTAPGYQAIDAHIMAATSTEAIGDKAKALAWFERSIGFYSDQLTEIGSQTQTLKQGEWFERLTSSSDSFWSPVVLTIDPQNELYLWTESVWQTEGFQQLLADYRDLVQLTELLKAKQSYMPTFEFMVENRKAAYDNSVDRVTVMEPEARLISYRKEAEHHKRKLKEVSDYKDVFAIGTKQQLIDQGLLNRVKENLAKLKAMKGYAQKVNVAPYESRFDHLQGIYLWEMREAFPANYRTYQREILSLESGLEDSAKALNKMNKAKALAPKRFEGFSKRIVALTDQVSDVVDRSVALRNQLKSESIALLEQELQKRERVAQHYLEQSILASARIRDEISNELGASAFEQTNKVAQQGGAQ